MVDVASAVENEEEGAGTRLTADEEAEAVEEAMPDTVTAGSVPLAGCTAGGVRMMPEMSALSAMLVVVIVT